jgi:hypothetical protein
VCLIRFSSDRVHRNAVDTESEFLSLNNQSKNVTSQLQYKLLRNKEITRMVLNLSKIHLINYPSCTFSIQAIFTSHRVYYNNVFSAEIEFIIDFLRLPHHYGCCMCMMYKIISSIPHPSCCTIPRLRCSHTRVHIINNQNYIEYLRCNVAILV